MPLRADDPEIGRRRSAKLRGGSWGCTTWTGTPRLSARTMTGTVAPDTAERPTETPPLNVSVVIPCLDEAGSIAACVISARQALAEGDYEGEVLVVDNGSTDGSGALAAAAGA